MTIEEVCSRFEYDAWATRQLLECAMQLPAAAAMREFPGHNNSVHGQFLHLLSVIDRYRARLEDAPVPDVQKDDVPSMESLQVYESRVRGHWNAFLESLTADALLEVRTHATRRGEFRLSTHDILLHIANHGTYHRGQIATLLKLHGFDFPDTDIPFWLNSRDHDEDA